MAKDKTAYVCSNCGQESSKWLGKCPSCGQWNTFREIRIAGNSAKSSLSIGQKNTPTSHKLRDIATKDEPRLDMHDNELNRVLGGGLVKGSIVLLGGEPGIGKSTLTLQTILNISDIRILYVSGEESAHQLKMRAERLSNGSSNNNDNIDVVCENSLESIINLMNDIHPQFVIIDSIQTIATDTVDSSPGSLTQVRECAAALLRYAKTSSTPIILIGHITKDGAIAGPKILEHIKLTPSYSLKATNTTCTASCAP